MAQTSSVTFVALNSSNKTLKNRTLSPNRSPRCHKCSAYTFCICKLLMASGFMAVFRQFAVVKSCRKNNANVIIAQDLFASRWLL